MAINQTKQHRMKGKRRRHAPEFKARVALEALKGIKTIQDIAKEDEIHPVQVSEWKKKMLAGAAEVFGPGSAKPSDEEWNQAATQTEIRLGLILGTRMVLS